MSRGLVCNDNMTQTRVPDKTRMRHYLASGLTQQQIVEAWEAESGHRVSRSAVAMAIERYGLKSSRPRPTYDELIPWRVATEHQGHIDARMLRLEGRRRAGLKLTEDQQRWLDQWKQDLLHADAVVAYDRNHPEGFFWVQRDGEPEDELILRNAAETA